MPTPSSLVGVVRVATPSAIGAVPMPLSTLIEVIKSEDPGRVAESLGDGLSRSGREMQ
jgi:hypothetical protein